MADLANLDNLIKELEKDIHDIHAMQKISVQLAKVSETIAHSQEDFLNNAKQDIAIQLAAMKEFSESFLTSQKKHQEDFLNNAKQDIATQLATVKEFSQSSLTSQKQYLEQVQQVIMSSDYIANVEKIHKEIKRVSRYQKIISYCGCSLLFFICILCLIILWKL